MPEDLSADRIAAARFRMTLRGFDPGEVQRFLEEVAAAMEVLSSERDRLSQRLAELGDRDLSGEFDQVASDVRRILDEAQATADGIRGRAAEDTEMWRLEARGEADATLTSAMDEAEALRRGAWTTSEQLVEQSAQEAERIRQGAERDALSILGEAERDAHRTISSARREAEDLVRVSKMESDRLLVDSRSKHDEIIDEARQEAETAQERARALEVRRAELLTELESVRSTIQRLETQIDERTAPPPPEAEPSTVRVLRSESAEGPPGDDEDLSGDDSTEWGTDDNVRVVPSPGMGAPTPEAPQTPVDATQMADEVRRLREAQQVASEATPETIEEQAAEQSEAPLEEVDELFARLRLEPAEVPRPEEEETETEEAEKEPPTPRSDPEEVQARLLVPIVNKRLRSVKRRLTDAQSVALEELRSDADWEPSAAALASELGPELSGLARESYAAGTEGAAELFGVTPEVGEYAAADPTEEFATALCEDVQSTLTQAREAGQDAAMVSSMLSRVYRTWRTDQSERRLAALAEVAFQEGMGDALAAAGIDSSASPARRG